jgi:hypothetical protein
VSTVKIERSRWEKADAAIRIDRMTGIRTKYFRIEQTTATRAGFFLTRVFVANIFFVF